MLLSLILMIFSFQQVSSQNFQAVDDTIDMVPGFSKTVNLLANDLIPSGDSIWVTGGISAGGGSVISTWHHQGIFTYLVPNRGVGTIVIGTYTLLNMTSSQSSTGHMIFRIRDKSYDTLKINDVEAIFTVSGFHFTLLFGLYSPGYIVPKGSGKSTVFSNSFWIGGLDENDSLHLAAEMYREGQFGQVGKNPDFYAGPVMDSTNYSIYQDTTWNYIWNLKRSDIEYHKTHWNDPDYMPIIDILTWPGNGNISLGQAGRLAPFHDENGDGIYRPGEGDYPAIRGDQALFFIFNDDRGKHLETGGGKLRVEVHGMAYAYNLPADSAFNKTIFLNYKVYNWSSRTFHDTYIGTFTDMDIGYWKDDFQQCDVGRGSIIGYNGRAVDGSGQPEAYGTHPPAQSVTFLAGPRMAPTGADRPRLDNLGHQLCNESINGAGFGDGIADNERMGLKAFSSFITPFNDPPAFMEQPGKAEDYYNYMQAVWMDSTRMVYGGKGHADYGGYGPETMFLFPGESDTMNWGCGCRQPNGPVNWTEVTAQNLPHDIKGIGSMGPFTFHPDEMQEFDYAFVWARDYTSSDTLASVAKLRIMIDSVRKAFLMDRLPGGGSFSGVRQQENHAGFSCNIYPNPATENVTLDFFNPLKEQIKLDVFNSAGKLTGSGIFQKGSIKTVLDVSDFTPGLYLFIFNGGGTHFTKPVSVVK